MIQKINLQLMSWSDTVNRILGVLSYGFALLAIFSLVADYGFYISMEWQNRLERIDLLIVLFYVLQYVIKIIFSRERLEFVKWHWFESSLVLVIVLRTLFLIQSLGLDVIGQYMMGIDVQDITKLTIVSAQIVIVLSLINSSLRWNRKIASLKFHPAQTLLLSFLIVIFIGTCLLMLPKAVQAGKDIGLLDALFTATSATCVTGLIVVDTGQHFSMLGQLIILFLIQIGGLGIMTLSSFLAIFFGRGMAIKERVLMQEMMNIDRLGVINRVLHLAVILTFLFEAAGALLLFLNWNQPDWTFFDRFYHSVFHSVSAFCNAGFSLNTDSVMGFSQNYAVMSTLMVLIVVGGLGFVVLMDIGGVRIKPINGRKMVRRWSVQTRLVLWISGILLLFGFVVLLSVEPFQGGWVNRSMQAMFSSVTARTAGFNTVNFGAFTIPAALLIIFLMFIGASPGSTGGGIKTTTFGILFASLISIISGKNRIELFRKSIPFTVLNRALVIFAFSITVISISVFFLTITEKAPLIDLVFEEVSAFATVGLSRGITSHLSDWGKIIISFSMFVGRIGALTLAFAITAPKEKLRIEYPQEKNVMVG